MREFEPLKLVIDNYLPAQSAGRMAGNLTTSLGLVVRLAQAQDEGVYRDQHSALAKAVCTYRMHEAVSWAGEILGGNGRSS
jgi:glutaryl-CoA dehydrogenase